MSIKNWEGVALIIGGGDIGECIFDYLNSVSPNLDLILCGRNFFNQNGIYLDLENDNSFTSFENKI